MFWKLIRWGGSLIVILLVLGAAYITSQGEDSAAAVQPIEPQQQPAKNFNL